MATDITPALQELDSIDSSYDRRRKIEAFFEDSVFTATVTAREVDRNYSYVREDGYRDGYAILGTIADVNSEVKILLPTKLNEQQIDRFYVNAYRFPGVSISASLQREYPLKAVGSSVVGYVGKINSQDLNQLNKSNYNLI